MDEVWARIIPQNTLHLQNSETQGNIISERACSGQQYCYMYRNMLNWQGHRTYMCARETMHTSQTSIHKCKSNLCCCSWYSKSQVQILLEWLFTWTIDTLHVSGGIKNNVHIRSHTYVWYTMNWNNRLLSTNTFACSGKKMKVEGYLEEIMQYFTQSHTLTTSCTKELITNDIASALWLTMWLPSVIQ